MHTDFRLLITSGPSSLTGIRPFRWDYADGYGLRLTCTLEGVDFGEWRLKRNHYLCATLLLTDLTIVSRESIPSSPVFPPAWLGSSKTPSTARCLSCDPTHYTTTIVQSFSSESCKVQHFGPSASHVHSLLRLVTRSPHSLYKTTLVQLIYRTNTEDS